MSIDIRAEGSREYIYRLWLDGVLDKFRGAGRMPLRIINKRYTFLNLSKKNQDIYTSFGLFLSGLGSNNLSLRQKRIVSFKLRKFGG